MPTLGPFYRWLRPSHWKHQNLDRSPQRDAEGGFHTRVWPKKHKNSVIDSLMNDSLVQTEPIVGKGFTSGAYEMQPSPGAGVARGLGGWGRSKNGGNNGYGSEKSDDFVDVVERAEGGKGRGQVAGDKMEIHALPETNFGRGVVPRR